MADPDPVAATTPARKERCRRAHAHKTTAASTPRVESLPVKTREATSLRAGQAWLAPQSSAPETDSPVKDVDPLTSPLVKSIAPPTANGRPDQKNYPLTLSASFRKILSQTCVS